MEQTVFIVSPDSLSVKNELTNALSKLLYNTQELEGCQMLSFPADTARRAESIINEVLKDKGIFEKQTRIPPIDPGYLSRINAYLKGST